MKVQLPRLTTSLRDNYDVDRAYVERKWTLRDLERLRLRTNDSQYRRKILCKWDEASDDVKQAYRQFLGAVIELTNGETDAEELKEVMRATYAIFSASDTDYDRNKWILEKKGMLQTLLGFTPSNASIENIALLVQKLSTLQSTNFENTFSQEDQSAGLCDLTDEFGIGLDFQAPKRFQVESVFSDALSPIEVQSSHSLLLLEEENDQFNFPQREGNVSLYWLKEACDNIVKNGCSNLSGDELAMALCRVLESNKAGDEIAGDLLDLVGDSAFETVQELLLHRKELVDSIHHGILVLKAEKANAGAQPKMPSYGTQVTIQTEYGKQIDKLRRKEEKKQKRNSERGAENDQLSAVGSFSSLLQASERKKPCDDFIGMGEDNSLPITALPQGTTRNYCKGYEEVIIPPAPTAQMKPGERLIEISELDDFAQAAFHGYKSLNRIQSHIFQAAYRTNENILVCAPTGAGKTNIAMIAILHEIRQHFKDGFLHKSEFKIVYVAPMKALAAEVASTFSNRLLPLNMTVKELTGDMQLSKNELEETQMIVTTPEKWDVITRKSSDMSMSMLVKLLIIDEVHLLNDERGPVIEALVARTLRQVESTQSMIRIVGLSATLPNYLQVAQFLRVNCETGLFFFDSSYRPVPLAQCYIGISERNFITRYQLLNEICHNKVVESLKNGHQVMVFVHSRKDTGKTARTLVEFAQRNDELSLFQSNEHPQFSLIKKEVQKSRNRELVELFDSGFGIHHAGMLRADRSLTERLFSDGLLKVLVCTATLAWGVNLPAHTVVIKGTQLYDPKAGGWRELGMLDVMQIFGRAGRPQFDKSGEGIIITTHDRLAYYLRLLTNQLPIESQFVSSLKDNMNAEVVLGTVTNVREACAWLGYTYLFIRMRTNPLAYGVGWEEVIADPLLLSKQRSLIIDAARALDKAKMMRFDEKSGNFYCTELGRIASHFYIRYSSVETYNEMLRRHMNDSEIITMVSHSSEFENIAVREEEQQELETLVRTSCPLEVRGGPGDKYGKISILIQVFISRGSLDSFSLVADAAYISASLARIMRGLFEICLRRGWSEMSSLLLGYCKAVDRQIWPHQHPLRQFDKDISQDILRRLEDRDADLDHLHELDEKDIGALIHYFPGGKIIKQYLPYFPWVHLSATVSPITRTVLKVDLLITPDFLWKDRFHGAAERWWILVEDSENDHIYHSELFTLTKKMARGGPQKINFTVPLFEPHPAQYYIRAVSDSWLQSEAIHAISFLNLTLPEADTLHTELLDLKPLPVTSLGNEIYEQLFKFSHFNPIQTQVFHVLYHTDQSVLLGAPTGSGKTICAELAIFHLFNMQPDMKVVYIAPLKAIVRERMNEWQNRLVSVLGKKMVEMTGDFTPDLMALLSADIIISTPEKWDGISRNWHIRTYVMKVGLMILDEIHLLGADRGPILEVIVSRMRYISSQTERAVRFVGLSTALANARDLADWLGVSDMGLFNFKPSVRPVPLEVHIQGYPGKFYCPRMNGMNKPSYAAICTHSPTKPVLIFVSSRRQTRLTALDLIQFAASDERPRQFLNMPEEELQMVLVQVKDLSLRHTLQFGIGLHHAGLNDKDRALVEEMFGNNRIQVLVSTSTLAWGVNLPAHLVIIKGTEFYDGKAKRYVDFPITDILQMMGRAGRPQYDQQGKAVILVHEPKKSFYKKFLYEPFPVESSLKDQLHDNINAEIVSGTICNKEDAVYYLTWTYLFRRLVVNPAYYGLEDADTRTVNSYLSRLVQNTLEDLEDSGCIKINENNVEPLMLGTVASQYYLSYMTVSMFGSNIGPDTSLEVFLHILSGATEYDELPVRHNEENINKTLTEKVRYLVDEQCLDDPHVKANLLFQSHFSQLELPISDYVTDMKSVLDQSIRIIQAMIDICANSGWLSSAITCMHLLQMVMQGLWFDQDSPLLMLPCMSSDLLRFLNKVGINSIQQLVELGKMNLQKMVSSFPSASLIVQEIELFPFLQVRIKLERNVKDGSRPSILIVKLESLNSRRKTTRAFAPRFPKIKEEAWWLILCNDATSELYTLKRVSLSKHVVTRMNFPSEPSNLKGMKLILMSDCYLGYELEYPIEELI
ncbi:DExH-box ATP-dependent RNA helicase DExH14 isoform X2 [Nymphaea colorata]|uniref:DExH-box ATP-dependent RNA helicase DExH14 isoform X2 n=1 Tax=Nymphaea colorata TaxID=210225 RepID=UPI00129DC5D8|nr:DExH-box ATP-dependent RNA helicase DExH14 isoform X2 [Nymphaea colorata]